MLFMDRKNIDYPCTCTSLILFSSDSSTAESSIQQSRELALKGSPKRRVTRLDQMFTRMKHWHRQERSQKASDSDDWEPPSKRKKRVRQTLRRRVSGSSSGSGELTYSESRSSLSGSGLDERGDLTARFAF